MRAGRDIDKLFTGLILKRVTDLHSKKNKRQRFFRIRVVLALGISLVADLLDYLVAPIFGVPILGDICDVFVLSLLFSITKSKVSLIMNLAEFIPFLGDFLPVYTVSTLIWILGEKDENKLVLLKRVVRLLSNKSTR
jgi:hypothetical protein